MITLEGVWRTFHMGGHAIHALRDVNLHIAPGSYVALTGVSGSGKSTLLNVLGLLDTPTAGRYRLDGQATDALDDTAQAALRGQRIGFVFQSFHLIARLSAADNVALPMTLAGVPPARRRARVAELLDRLGLTDRAAHKPAQLSGGQRQRVAIARAMAMKPALLLADEPTGNLDQASGQEVVRVIEQLHAEGLTVVVVTHDAAIAARAARRIAMRDGAVVADDGA